MGELSLPVDTARLGYRTRPTRRRGEHCVEARSGFESDQSLTRVTHISQATTSRSPADKMFHVVCASTASHLLTKAELQAMLEETREISARVGVTGSLLYKDGNFLRVLEGDQEAVMKLVSRVKVHQRHKDFPLSRLVRRIPLSSTERITDSTSFAERVRIST